MKTLTVIPTMHCQLSCSFCLCRESLNKDVGSSVEDMVKFIDWQINISDENESFIIEFFGGEPTLAWDKVRAVQKQIEAKHTDRNINWTLYTNGVVPNTVSLEEMSESFDEIIVSVEGDYELSNDRHPSIKSHTKAVNTIKSLLALGHCGVAFVLDPNQIQNTERIVQFFENLGCNYYNFEILTHINNDKDSGLTLEHLYYYATVIFEHIVKHNLKHPDSPRGFTIPREFLASRNFYMMKGHKSCLEAFRALSPTGNVYPCRDWAANEDKLLKQSDPKSIYRSNQVVPFNIKTLTLDKDSNEFPEEAKAYDQWIACPAKSAEHYHFIGGSMPWIKDEVFQDLIILPLFLFSWDLFNHYHNNSVKQYLEGRDYDSKVSVYASILEALKPRYGRLATDLRELQGNQ